MPGQHQVEQDRVVSVLAGQPESVRAVVCDVDGKALRLQAQTQGPGEAYLVIDHEYPHQTIVARGP